MITSPSRRNSAYLIEGREDWPSSLLIHSGFFANTTVLRSRIYACKRHGAPLSEADLGRLRWCPDLAASLLVEGILDQEETANLLGHHHVFIFRTLLARYDDLHSRLVPHLYADPESIERLIIYLDRERGQSPAEAAALRARLDDDPARRLEVEPDAGVRASLLARYRKALPDRRRQSPAWAWFALLTEGPESIDENALRLLSLSNEHGYLAARELHERKALSDVVERLVDSLKEPRWIYHALRDELSTRPDRGEAALQTHPAWYIHYLVRGRLDPTRARNLSERLVEDLVRKPAPDPLENDVRTWHHANLFKHLLVKSLAVE